MRSQVTSFTRGSISDIDEDLELRLKDLTPEVCVRQHVRFIVLDT